jgi:carbon monoxide dehydrogenase subunit G
VELSVDSTDVYPFVSDLQRYAEWMPLIHSVASTGENSWDVELRAKIGLLARSKRLSMRRTSNSPGLIVFERDESDGRAHSSWTLTVRTVSSDKGCVVTMEMAYGGTLWTAGILDRVLASQVEAGKAGLARVVQGA